VTRGRGKRKMTANVNGISSWDEESILELGSGDDCTTLWIHLKPLSHILQKSKIMVCELY
jgi:hypothetical protein